MFQPKHHFKPGDLVVCIDNESCYLTVGKTYKVHSLFVLNDRDVLNRYSVCRFTPHLEMASKLPCPPAPEASPLPPPVTRNPNDLPRVGDYVSNMQASAPKYRSYFEHRDKVYKVLAIDAKGRKFLIQMGVPNHTSRANYWWKWDPDAFMVITPEEYTPQQQPMTATEVIAASGLRQLGRVPSSRDGADYITGPGIRPMPINGIFITHLHVAQIHTLLTRFREETNDGQVHALLTTALEVLQKARGENSADEVQSPVTEQGPRTQEAAMK